MPSFFQRFTACYEDQVVAKDEEEPVLVLLPTDFSDSSSDDENDVLECLYENVTLLFQALEDKAWIAAYEMLHREEEAFLAKGESMADQARTWVTKYDQETGKLVWSQLPLHAAIVFKAPFKVIESILTLFPRGLKCKDDQGNLPLHLAFKSGSSDKILKMILTGYPKAVNIKGHRGRVPHEMCENRYHIMEVYMNETKISMRMLEIESKERVKQMKKVLEEEKEKLIMMEKAYETEKDKVEMMQEKIYALKRRETTAKLPYVRSTDIAEICKSINSKRGKNESPEHSNRGKEDIAEICRSISKRGKEDPPESSKREKPDIAEICSTISSQRGKGSVLSAGTWDERERNKLSSLSYNGYK